mgnify:CR=1 FL=1
MQRIIATLILAALPVWASAAQPAGHGSAASNMRLVGASELQGRTGFEIAITQQGKRWIAYVGHFGGESVNPLTGQKEPNGTSILDVTDPRTPKYLHHIPSESRTLVAEGAGSGAHICGIYFEQKTGTRFRYVPYRGGGPVMTDLLANLALGFGVAFSPSNLLFCMIGTLVGTLIGVLPGVGPLATIAGIETVVINDGTTLPALKQDLRNSEVYYHLAQGIRA